MEQPAAVAPEGPDPLGAGEAGLRTVRGGIVRVVGYVVGSALAAGGSVLLLRYLGVVHFGEYVTVISLLSIVTGLSDVGLSLVGQREYVLQTSDKARSELMGNILGIRLAISPVAVVLAVLFSVVAGYGSTLIVGTLVAGCSLLFGNVALTLAIPLTVNLRLGALTAAEVARQALVVGGNGLLVVVGATLLAFFSVPVVAALGSALLAAILLGRPHLSRPRFRWSEWRVILRQAAPMGVAVIVSVLYLRTLVVMSSLLTGGFQTGIFATSYRVLEILAAVPALMVGSAFPVMARAGSGDEARLGYVLQRLVEASLLVAVLFVLVVAIGAQQIVVILGGDAYRPAAEVLRIQSFALLGSFVSVIWTTALIAIRRQSDLIVINAVALTAVLGLGGALIPLYGARGAAIAAVAGEFLLALVSLMMLLRARPALRPSGRFLLKLAGAAGCGAACALIPGLPALGAAAIAAVVYGLVTLCTGAVPTEVSGALISWRRRPAQ